MIAMRIKLPRSSPLSGRCRMPSYFGPVYPLASRRPQMHLRRRRYGTRRSAHPLSFAQTVYVYLQEAGCTSNSAVDSVTLHGTPNSPPKEARLAVPGTDQRRIAHFIPISRTALRPSPSIPTYSLCQPPLPSRQWQRGDSPYHALTSLHQRREVLEAVFVALGENAGSESRQFRGTNEPEKSSVSILVSTTSPAVAGF